jgi:hypothetical protein
VGIQYVMGYGGPTFVLIGRDPRPDFCAAYELKVARSSGTVVTAPLWDGE